MNKWKEYLCWILIGFILGLENATWVGCLGILALVGLDEYFITKRLDNKP